MLAALALALGGSIVFAHRLPPPNLRVHAQAIGTPSIGRRKNDRITPSNARFVAVGTWVMSSLPACFVERLRVRGTSAQVRGDVPPASERVPDASVLHVGDCTITVGAHDLLIARADDRLRVPPEAALYRHAGHLTLVTVREGMTEIRGY